MQFHMKDQWKLGFCRLALLSYIIYGRRRHFSLIQLVTEQQLLAGGSDWSWGAVSGGRLLGAASPHPGPHARGQTVAEGGHLSRQIHARRRLP